MITLYSTGCPQCKALKMKLDKKEIEYKVCTNEEVMKALGLKSAPALMVGEDLYGFAEAVKWVNEQ